MAIQRLTCRPRALDLHCVVWGQPTMLIFRGRTPSRRFTLGTRLERFLIDFCALLDRFVAMIISSFDLVWIYRNLRDPCC
jgi:hypothetical protein